MIIWEYMGPDALQGGHIGRLKVNLRNYFCIFYSFELKLCRMVELCIAKKSYVFYFSILTFFWRECDVTRLTAKLTFPGMAKEIIILKRARRDGVKWEKNFEKLNWLKPICYFFRNISTFQDALYLLKQLSFSKKFSHLFLSHHTVSKLFICFAIT